VLAKGVDEHLSGLLDSRCVIRLKIGDVHAGAPQSTTDTSVSARGALEDGKAGIGFEEVAQAVALRVGRRYHHAYG
jgi:hypothetical protein